ncbi:MAG: CIA30 family protein [Bacteroidales bacterium]|nr:CIA30 family protein [Bacteroidales bacterium]MCF8402728.1 CIA30 family protein [Bacteroidales bacterium]
MRTIFLTFITLIMVKGDIVLFDFDSANTSGKWYVVNDDVMGGVSESKIAINSNGTATFSGTISGDNFGGFASVRARIENIPDENFKGVQIRLKGDGKSYNIRFRTDLNFDGYAYQAKVLTQENVWKEYKIPFKDFEPKFRGRTLSGKPELESKNIMQTGILIADKQFGEFSLDIDWIKFYD